MSGEISARTSPTKPGGVHLITHEPLVNPVCTFVPSHTNKTSSNSERALWTKSAVRGFRSAIRRFELFLSSPANTIPPQNPSFPAKEQPTNPPQTRNFSTMGTLSTPRSVSGVPRPRDDSSGGGRQIELHLSCLDKSSAHAFSAGVITVHISSGLKPIAATVSRSRSRFLFLRYCASAYRSSVDRS